VAKPHRFRYQSIVSDAFGKRINPVHCNLQPFNLRSPLFLLSAFSFAPRFPHSAFRVPRSAFRFPLSAFCFLLSAFPPQPPFSCPFVPFVGCFPLSAFQRFSFAPRAPRSALRVPRSAFCFSLSAFCFPAFRFPPRSPQPPFSCPFVPFVGCFPLSAFQRFSFAPVVRCPHSSKRTGGFIPRIALDQCRHPERYRTRVSNHGETTR
jgi:hypothetical protein